MCMEDIRLGRKSYGTESQIAIGTGETALVGPAPNRVALSIYPVVTNPVFVSTIKGVTPANGMRIVDNAGPLVMTLETHGSLVRKGWFAAVPAGAATVTIVEVLLEDQ